MKPALLLSILLLASVQAIAGKEGGGGGEIKKDFETKASTAIRYLRGQSQVDSALVDELDQVLQAAKVETPKVLLNAKGRAIKNQEYLYAFSIPKAAAPLIQLRMRSEAEKNGTKKDFSWQGKFETDAVGLDDVTHELLQASSKYAGQDDDYQISRGRLGLNKISANVFNVPNISSLQAGDFYLVYPADHTEI